MNGTKIAFIGVLAIGLALTAGCPKQATTPTVPVAPVAAVLTKPEVNFFTADPVSIVDGQSTVLHWSVRNADHVLIDNGVGQVDLNGLRSVSPKASTTYRLEATNEAGTTVAILNIVARVQPSSSARDGENQKDENGSVAVLAARLQDIHFTYGEEKILDSDVTLLTSDEAVLKNLLAADPSVIVVIEGHCDERGSSEYNIALGDKRADAVKELFIRSGLPETNLRTMSYGKEQPTCLDLTEACYTRNRRVHFSASK